jgi:hypothetical protein
VNTTEMALVHTVLMRMPPTWQRGLPTGCLTCAGYGVVAGEACHCVVHGLRAVQIGVVRLPTRR